MDVTMIWAGIAILGVLGWGISIGIIGKASLDALARNPQVWDKAMTYAILGMALAEATSIYAFVTAVMIILNG